MADDITLGSMSGGSVVATDEVTGTGEHVQVVKLAYSADGSRTPITADTNGLKVNVGNTVTVSLGSALPTGANVIGAVTQSGTWNVGLSTGSNVIGAVTQSGTWNIGSITTLPSIPAGTNAIGVVGNRSGTTLGQGFALPSTTATLIAAAVSSSPFRRSITICNVWSVDVRIGGSGVTSGSGILLVPGAAVTLTEAANAAVYGITASGTGIVNYLTESD